MRNFVRHFRQLLKNVLFFGGPVFVLLTALAAAALAPIFGPIEPANVDRATLVRIMQLRDFQKMSTENRAAWTDRAEAEFGRGGVMRPVFAFSPLEKKIYAHFRGSDRPAPSRFERNLQLMARIRYFQWMSEYEQATEPERALLMRRISDDMTYWEWLYYDFLSAAELPRPTWAELIQEFEKMIEGFKVGATPEEQARIDRFKNRMNAAMVAGRIGGAAQKISDNVHATVSGVLGTFLPKPKTESPVGSVQKEPETK